jgi:hypothetical protein
MVVAEHGRAFPFVMAGLGPAIHALRSEKLKGVDARNKCGHDGEAGGLTVPTGSR